MEQISKVSAVKIAMAASGFSAEEAEEFNEESCVKLFDNGIKTRIRLQVSDDTTITVPMHQLALPCLQAAQRQTLEKTELEPVLVDLILHVLTRQGKSSLLIAQSSLCCPHAWRNGPLETIKRVPCIPT